MSAQLLLGHVGSAKLAYEYPSSGQESTPRCRLTVLGSGTLASFGQRWPAGYVIETCLNLALLDCNSRGLARFLQYGFDLQMLAAICIGHDHSDHSLGLVEWLEVMGVHCQLKHITSPLKAIVSPPRLYNTLQRDIRQRISGDPSWLSTTFPWLNIPADSQNYFTIKDLDITRYPTTHDPSLSESIGFRVVWNGRTIAYPCDFGSLQDQDTLIPSIHNADLLILDAGAPQPNCQTHLHISEAIKLKDRAGAHLLVVSHIPDIPGRVEAVQEFIVQHGRTHDVVIATDGMYFDFV